MTRLMIAAVLCLMIAPAHADSYTYRCKAKGKPSVVKIEDAKKTLVWQGKTYKLARELTGDECAKLAGTLRATAPPATFARPRKGSRTSTWAAST